MPSRPGCETYARRVALGCIVLPVSCAAAVPTAYLTSNVTTDKVYEWTSVQFDKKGDLDAVEVLAYVGWVGLTFAGAAYAARSIARNIR